MLFASSIALQNEQFGFYQALVWRDVPVGAILEPPLGALEIGAEQSCFHLAQRRLVFVFRRHARQRMRTFCSNHKNQIYGDFERPIKTPGVRHLQWKLVQDGGGVDGRRAGDHC